MAIGSPRAGADNERSWRDLRRREVAFWTVVLSYLPAVGLAILAAGLLSYDVPRNLAVWVAGGWIAFYVAASLHRRGFRCPRCHNLYFRRGQTSSARACAHCTLPCWALEDPDGDILSQR